MHAGSATAHLPQSQISMTILLMMLQLLHEALLADCRQLHILSIERHGHRQTHARLQDCKQLQQSCFHPQTCCLTCDGMFTHYKCPVCDNMSSTNPDSKDRIDKVASA